MNSIHVKVGHGYIYFFLFVRDWDGKGVKLSKILSLSQKSQIMFIEETLHFMLTVSTKL